MALEHRGNRQYYYRARRIGGRVVKQYIGTDEIGRQAAEADQACRAARQQAAKLRAEQNRPADELAAALDELGQLVDMVVECQLICAGWRKHHREWRPNYDRRRKHNR